ncbi:histone-lysine N-methyltransferase SETMAR [Plakobranchus ocellatus]|uniref:Histone-lysine N-methyltransferase SETMAR n=1 Tax=Plakobranchus ocellatus TaxID=259542 RepID=A0AAV4A0R4_9GAST|nr:histone-lysine N-methyltransferase SETMAR [Plakobranchus ocellatus]
MATSNDLLIKKRSVIEFLAAEGCSAANIHARMKTVYRETCISDCTFCKWCDKDSNLQRDNVRPHTSRKTQDALRQLELTTLPHLAYSLYLAPSFPQLKKYLKGHHFDNDEEVIADGAVDSRLNSSLTACANL